MSNVPIPINFVPVPRFAAGSGVPRGRSPLGCAPCGGSEKALRDGDELGKRPTYSVRQSVIRVGLPIPFRERRPYVQTMRFTIQIGPESAVRDSSPN